ncbi:glutamine--fructose-6-phosphate aminotransferase [isomerizing] [Thermobispora bispora]|jgi:glutamine---fructose-6-phosphate transaminase (isomerizing)|uniref:Glutamine--fructose-6-phosphate aminotransferase [isomerizing] n=1 Tax=Thermobispora bispora (strain ATCC 19993 / DSM 43833 / CBS 139.67 / JCM 10125 / KCTC 9307 / NBRC 14880 / R51) TaxID=469371 RepID=D6Y2I0_THEBD|nr:glutamine--fructose-6-phosphate transaminase (isomerizing) [Thermobispora bispora]MBO2473413.1 glutamine--fructose-6-phosphate transaminase (isomerizing) [Actinomycetales bacterium]MDI9581099.1 glutamine--fructose-6-phosphate transaminase (isomerizing) [Thermobispora sp.]ADG88829.1 glucosamine/fructose-6-phosphate aminotransferase, isomerizing [Thermobispora bispora DSM 43833]MBX6166437.1 glutamine--fructose-6-phosphate transaminase (isomerizing) [Thermobispora bispora]QSI48592.1 glutamine-
MCGIVAYVGRKDAAPILLEGLQRLEYRGYDSAGLAVVSNKRLKTRKVKGRVADLAAAVPARFKGTTGIGHTRWATHGAPSDVNAHPHLDAGERIAVVHNGIIENADDLRRRLEADGVAFVSETDTEVLAHLIGRAVKETETLAEAVRRALKGVVGTYGIAVLDAERPGEIVVARNGSPIVLGIGEKEMFAASDVAALIRYTRQVVHLEDGELAVIKADGFSTFTSDATETAKEPLTVDWDAGHYDTGGYEHYLLKEICEQPDTVARALRGRIDDRFHIAHLGGLNMDARELRSFRRVKIIGCGSAYYSGQMGAQLIEELARIPADAEPASEFRYRNPVVEGDTLYVAVSQSGETYDTLAAVQELKRKGARVLGIVNTVGSAIARECDGGVYLHAGPEVSVASTKAFTSTAVVFALLALHLGRVRDLSPAEGKRICDGLRRLPEQIKEILTLEEQIRELAIKYSDAPGMMFVGRVRGFPVAREGAQKLKEVSYIHAEAYPASELKHGPLALISPELPTVAIVPDDELLDKNLTTLEEIRARNGRIVMVGHRATDAADDCIVVPKNENELDPILLTIPLQLFAYHAAVALGRDVDKPRNLAKSVTVE